MSFEGKERRRRINDRRRSVELRPTVAKIELDHLSHNIQTIQAQLSAGCRILAVVKADGYGHGAYEVAQEAMRCGVWGVAVSLVEEGVELRQRGLQGPIVVLGGVPPGSENAIVHRSLTPVVWSASHLDRLAGAVRKSGAPPLPIHLKIDTGMSRLGLLPEELNAWLEHYENTIDDELFFEGALTHLSCADDPQDQFSSAQIARFLSSMSLLTSRGFHPEIRHVCNSAGLVRFPEAHFDMVRPGIALYGGASSSDVALHGLKMTMSLHSEVLDVRELPSGAAISYGRSVVLDRPSRVGIVPVGYGDGYPRNMSRRASVLVRGHRCPVLGNITMDISMIDVTDLPDVRPREQVTLLGRQGKSEISVYEFAEWAGILPYEVVCGISKRVPRKIRDRG